MVGAVTGLMDMDVSATGLKALQGRIWRDGYERGALQGHVFKDTVALLKWCRETGVVVSIFSSASVNAQKLLFGHSSEGDLVDLISHHFDKETGSKKKMQSYGEICKGLGIRPR